MTRLQHTANLIDGGPQAYYITGWQYHGFDTGYPYIEETDPRCGTVEELRQCVADGARCNAMVGMHDNYDDCYLSPHFDGVDRALDEYGRPWRGWIWAGGLSYIIGFRKYLESGHMQERVRRTVERYGLRGSYHIDVLTSEVRRYDFDPRYPAAADASLQAKLAIVREFNKYDVDITSETLTHPFVGSIGYAWSTRDNPQTVLFPGERYIPLVGMIYHGTIGYSGAPVTMPGLLWGMLRGSAAGFSEAFGEEERDMRGYYLLSLPIGLLGQRQIADIKEDGPVMRAVYDAVTWVQVDFAEKRYEIVIEGVPVARDWTTFAPGHRPGSYLAYARDGGEIRYPAPTGWTDGTVLHAVTLTMDGEGESVACSVLEGQVVITMPTGVPVRIVPVK